VLVWHQHSEIKETNMGLHAFSARRREIGTESNFWHGLDTLASLRVFWRVVLVDWSCTLHLHFGMDGGKEFIACA
jgi:hypothetical protein